MLKLLLLFSQFCSKHLSYIWELNNMGLKCICNFQNDSDMRRPWLTTLTTFLKQNKNQARNIYSQHILKTYNYISKEDVWVKHTIYKKNRVPFGFHIYHEHWRAGRTHHIPMGPHMVKLCYFFNKYSQALPILWEVYPDSYQFLCLWKWIWESVCLSWTL